MGARPVRSQTGGPVPACVVSHVDSLPEAYVNLRRRGSRSRVPDSLIAEGPRTVARALESTWPIVSLVLTPPWFQRLQARIEDRRPPVPRVYLLEKAELDRAVGFKLRQGILAELTIPKASPLNEWMRGLPEEHRLIALDGLTDAENVGAVARNAAAFGVQGFLTDTGSADPFLRRAARVSLGAVFHLPVRREDSLPEVLLLLKKQRGTSIVVTHLDEDAQSPEDIDWSGNHCLVLGSEDAGVSRACLDLADRRVCIPMQAGWDSLNVAAASAVLLYESTRARGLVGKTSPRAAGPARHRV